MSPPAPAVSTVSSWAGATRERSRASAAPAVTQRIRFTGRSSLARRGYPFATRARGESLGRGLGLRALIHGTLRRDREPHAHGDRKSTRLNSSHGYNSYAVFCLKKKKNKNVAVQIESQREHI